MFEVRNDVMKAVNNAHISATNVSKDNSEAITKALKDVSSAITKLNDYHKAGFWGFIFSIIDRIKGTMTTLQTDQTALQTLLPQNKLNQVVDNQEKPKTKDWPTLKAEIDNLNKIPDEDERREKLIKFLSDQGSFNPKELTHTAIIIYFVESGHESELKFFKDSTGVVNADLYETMFKKLAQLGQGTRLLNQLLDLNSDQIERFMPIWLNNGPKQSDFEAARGSERLSQKIIAQVQPGQGRVIKEQWQGIIKLIEHKSIKPNLSKEALEAIKE